MSQHHRTLAFLTWLTLASIIIAATAAVASASTMIGSLPDSHGGFGTAEDAGQTFVVPTDGDNAFSNFTCYLGGAGGSITFTTSLYQFSGSQIVGSPLYTSAPQVAVQNAIGTPFSFSPTTPIPLQPGGTYIFTFHQSAAVPAGNIQWDDSNNYPNGELRQTNSVAPYTNANWTTYPPEPTLDMAFTATFVPEPAGLSGLFVVWALGRRCRRGVNAKK